jgi:hypothetical protein
VSSRLPSWANLKAAAPDHVSPPPTVIEKGSAKHGVEHTAVRVECACGHATVWAATREQAMSKWLNHLAVASGLKPAHDHRKITPGSHPRRP